MHLPHNVNLAAPHLLRVIRWFCCCTALLLLVYRGRDYSEMPHLITTVTVLHYGRGRPSPGLESSYIIFYNNIHCIRLHGQLIFSLWCSLVYLTLCFCTLSVLIFVFQHTKTYSLCLLSHVCFLIKIKEITLFSM